MLQVPAIELALPADAPTIAPAIAAMSRELIEYGLPWGWRAERVADAIASAETNVAIVREGNGQTIGQANGEAHGLIAFGIMEYVDDDAHLVLFAVRPERQRRGVGTALLAWLEACARVAGSERIQVESRRENDAARCFYNENGYHEQVIERRMYSGRIDGVRLQKWLRPQPPPSR